MTVSGNVMASLHLQISLIPSNDKDSLRFRIAGIQHD